MLFQLRCYRWRTWAWLN